MKINKKKLKPNFNILCAEIQPAWQKMMLQCEIQPLTSNNFHQFHKPPEQKRIYWTYKNEKRNVSENMDFVFKKQKTWLDFVVENFENFENSN